MCMNNLERIQRLRLIDDDFMRVVFKDKDCCQLLLEVILDRKDFEIVTLETQKDLKNLHGKSVCCCGLYSCSFKLFKSYCTAL